MTSGNERRLGSTPRMDEARESITRTTITPGPGSEVDPVAMSPSTWRDRLAGHAHGELSPPQEPLAAASILRLVIAAVLSVLCVLTVGGAILVLLLWQQNRASGVLTDQLDRTWDLFDALRVIERWVAFVAILLGSAWLAVASINVRRATGVKRNPVVAALSLPIGVVGVWAVGDQIVAEADDWVGQASGFVLQCVFLAVPVLVLLRLAQPAESRNRPIRVAFVVAGAYLAQMQFLAGLSTTDQTSPAEDWGRLGAYLVIGALLQVLGALAVNEAARSIEDGTQHRFELRHRFGESLLSQANRA